MAPSHLSGMEMRTLLFGVLLGLLAVVYSTPAPSTGTQDEVYREVVTDGYLIDSHILSSLTTESPKSNTTTVAASHQPPVESEDNQLEGSGESTTSEFELALSLPATLLPRVTEDSGSSETNETQPENESNDESPNAVHLGHEGEHHATTTPSVSHSQSSTVFPSDTGVSILDFFTTQTAEGSGDDPTHIPEMSGDGPTQSTEGSGDQGSGAETTTAFTTLMTKTEQPGSGNFTEEGHPTPANETSLDSSISRSGRVVGILPMPTEESNATTTTGMVEDIIIPDSQPPIKAEHINKETQSQGHTTPGWIIIVGFIVGLAALVMLCAAIATRDKWNGPKQASQVGADANSSNQQRELEMETFLHNDKPRENGKAADYTVIPLDDVPENYSSH